MMMPIVILGFGILADQVSCRKLILTGSFLSIIYCALMPVTQSVTLIGSMIALGGIGITLAFIITNVLFLKTIHYAPKRGKKLSIFVACMTSGYAIGSATCSIFIHELSFPVSSIFYSALPLHAIAFLLVLGFPEVAIERFPLIQYFHDITRFPVFC